MTAHDNNVYAFNTNKVAKHISEVDSGRKGYFCMGCGQEMIARKGDIRTHHFAHDPKDVQRKGKCTFSDETYRHKLAKEILQRIKRIKVPPVYKYPPLGVEGRAREIFPARVIYADHVKIELQCYENEDGEICYGKRIEFKEGDNRYLLIQPDVVFLDKKEQPILLVEIVATHKIDTYKLSKIKRLGVDTIQITIPKVSPEEIEKAFSLTRYTEWIYNNEQEKADYFSLPSGDGEGVSPISEFQRNRLKIEESFACRKAEIGNLIRGIRKVLDSKQYRGITEGLRAELQRVKRNTEKSQLKWLAIQADHQRGIHDEFREEKATDDNFAKSIEDRRGQLREEERKLDGDYSEAHRRIGRIQKHYRSEFEDEIRIFEKLVFSDKGRRNTLRSENENASSFNRKIENLAEHIRTEEESLRELEKKRDSIEEKQHEIESAH